MKIRMQKYRRWGLCLIIGWVLVLLGTAIPADIAEAQVTEEWVARYNGTGDGSDIATALAVDDSGNVYVTGRSQGSGTSSDYATVKYNAAGVVQWVVRYDNDGRLNSPDQATAVAVDGAGNVYVTGSSVGSDATQDWDYATVKYNAAGVVQWVARYDGPGNKDLAAAIAVDTLGNVYVTGTSWGGPRTRDDYATVKYDPAGNQLWVARYNNGPGKPFDSATAIAVDGAGNVYVTGSSIGSGFWDYATVKYDGAGNELWVGGVRYNGPGNSWDSATAIAVDGSGNVYVTGRSQGSGTSWDYATVKYNAAGNQLWEARYDRIGFDDQANALAVDGAGNVYVTGSSIGSGTSWDYATMKYNGAGVEQWVARYDNDGSLDSSDFARALAIDGAGNVYVTGSSIGSGTGFDYATVKYNPAGTQLWVERYDGNGLDDIAKAIAVDADNGNIQVTGSSLSFVGPGTLKKRDDYATVKYNQNPPVAKCTNVTVDADDTCRASASIDNGSFHPNGDPITITQNPAGPYGLVPTTVALTVSDGEFSDTCTATVTVEDNSCPTVTAQLVPVKVKKRKGCFLVELTVEDNCDKNPQVVATINGTNGAGVVDGQLVELKYKKKYKVKTEDGDSNSDDCGTVKLEGPDFTLFVRAWDFAGNHCEYAADTFVFPTKHDGDSKSHDDKSSDDDSKSNDDDSK